MLASRANLLIRQSCRVARNVRWASLQATTSQLRNNLCVNRSVFQSSRSLCAAKAEVDDNGNYHNIIKDEQKVSGAAEKREFQAETRALLDIVATSLYSHKEVYIRELISNASDALEKLRYMQTINTSPIIGVESTLPISDIPLEIHIATDKQAGTFTIQDTGVGMTKEELISNLGTIARSGSKGKASADTIIGQFGVGFYSAFMVADKVEVYSKSQKPGSKGFHWSSDGSGMYEIAEAENVQPGTKIVVHLKPSEIGDFADDAKVDEVIKKYSNFVTCPIFLNGRRVNTINAIWNADAKDVSINQHDEFYRFLTHNQNDRPRYCLHYKADAPVNIRAILYVPESKPSLMDLGPQAEVGVALYSRRVLIQPRTSILFPKWMRFLKGVVDSEDIPLNLSRELLQQTAVINKLRSALSYRVLKFFQDQMKRDRPKYEDFHNDFGLYMKECIISSTDQAEKEDVAKLLLFESSNHMAGVKVSFAEYCSRMQAGQREIYYLCAPSRHLAETSPYYEAIKAKNHEVLFCYEAYDELVLLQLQQFDRMNLISVEKAIRKEKTEDDKDVPVGEGHMSKENVKSLSDWIKSTLGGKCTAIKSTSKVLSHPCFITVEEMGAARHFVKTQFVNLPEEQRYLLLQPTLEINPSHPIMVKLNELRTSNPELGKLIVEQVFDNAMISAGLLEDSRNMVSRMNLLIEKLLTTHS